MLVRPSTREIIVLQQFAQRIATAEQPANNVGVGHQLVQYIATAMVELTMEGLPLWRVTPSCMACGLGATCNLAKRSGDS